jgi:hypothetical protein
MKNEGDAKKETGEGNPKKNRKYLKTGYRNRNLKL